MPRETKGTFSVYGKDGLLVGLYRIIPSHDVPDKVNILEVTAEGLQALEGGDIGKCDWIQVIDHPDMTREEAGDFLGALLVEDIAP